MNITEPKYIVCLCTNGTTTTIHRYGSHGHAA